MIHTEHRMCKKRLPQSVGQPFLLCFFKITDSVPAASSPVACTAAAVVVPSATVVCAAPASASGAGGNPSCHHTFSQKDIRPVMKFRLSSRHIGVHRHRVVRAYGVLIPDTFINLVNGKDPAAAYIAATPIGRKITIPQPKGICKESSSRSPTLST